MGSIYKGSTKVNKLYFGNKAIQKVYKGSTLIWSAGEKTYVVYKGKNPWVKSNWMELTESTAYNSNYGYVVMPYMYEGDEYATVFPLEAFTANKEYTISRFNAGVAPRLFWNAIDDCAYSGDMLDIVKELDLNDPEKTLYELQYLIEENTDYLSNQKYFDSYSDDYIGCDKFLDNLTPIGTNMLYATLPNIFVIYQMWQRREVLYHFLYEVYDSRCESMWIGYYVSEDSWDNWYIYLNYVLKETEFANVGTRVDYEATDGDGNRRAVVPFYQMSI